MGRARATSLKNEKSPASSLLNRRRNRRSSTLRVSWRDEQVDGTSLKLNLDNAAFNDPAILAAKSVVRYTREELIRLRQVPLSQRKPEHLNAIFNNPVYSPNGVRDPELFQRNRSETPNENGIRNDDMHKRRPGDPRERIRKEQDGIVLSPQRRSFNSGCFVPLKDNHRGNRQHSPIGKTEAPHIAHREISQGTRRIGSGRILTRDVPWDFQEKQEIDNDFGYRRDDRFERRFGRDFEKDKEKHTGRSGRFGEGRRRMPSDNKDEEPEWFSGGPLSQAETIELRGFEDNDCEKLAKKKLSNAQKKRLKERGNAKMVENQVDTKDKEESNKKPNTPEVGILYGKQTPILEKEKDLETKPKMTNMIDSDHTFSLDEILKCDTIANLLPNGVSGEKGESSGSRFSRWFKRESPVKLAHTDSRRSSLQDDHLIRNLLNDITEPNVAIPGDSDLYFAPISPAANTGNSTLPSQKPLNLMEMLYKGKSDNYQKNMEAGGKVLSLAELEARMLQQGAGDGMGLRGIHVKQTAKSDEDMIAFKQLLAQVSGGQAVTATNGPVKTQSMSILEMLSHSQQQDEAACLSSTAQMMGPISPNPISTALNNDLAFKVQNYVQAQRQQAKVDMLNKLLTAGIHRQPLTSPLHDIGLNQSRELLNRPEAQAILQATHQRIPSPRELQVHTQNIMQQALIKKKLEEQTENYKKRQEMQRGQSPGRGLSPAKHISSPTPLAFTPTSVLRKMTAEKDDPSKDNSKSSDIYCKIPQGRPVTGVKPLQQPQPQQTWNMQLKQPVGRPIVKANTNLQTTQDQFYQQRMFNQQQQQRKLGPHFPSISHSQTGASSHQQLPLHYPTYSSNPQPFQQQLTQHQLRAQHQQHQPPQQTNLYGNRSNSQLWSQQHHSLLMGSNYEGRISHMGERGGNSNNNGGELSPTSNQLARWFSPELLERARAGKVPNLPSTATAQHAISLEELERQTAPPIHN
ncbi:hypothetical protein FQA39_LY14231 [Lamprigera yunnana]|nr:hypothetical protein FQA39_LY14231 [Lamprigera yunnana]